MKSRKKINPAGDKADDERDVDSGFVIHTMGGGKMESLTVKQHGRRPLTMSWCRGEPTSPETHFDIPQANVDGCVKLLEDELLGKATFADVEAFLLSKTQNEREPEPEPEPCDSCNGKWHRPLTVEPPCVPPKEPSSGDQDVVEPYCEICFGRHKNCPLTIRLPCGPIPKVNPEWYVACWCCRGNEFEEKTDDCAECGSTRKHVLMKSCDLCLEAGHFDNSDKACIFYGKKVRDKFFPFRPRPPKPSGPGIKKSRPQPRRSRKKLAKKKKEVKVVPGDDAGAGAGSAVHDLA